MGLQDFSKFLYNSQEGTCMGRTLGSWTKISIFYLIYYAFLTFLFYGSVMLSKSTLKVNDVGEVYDKPKLQSRVDQPGVAVYPQNLDDDDNNNFEFSLTKTIKIEGVDTNLYVAKCQDFLNRYKGKTETYPEAKMFFDNGIVDMKKLSDMAKARTPYIFLTVNKIINWEPEYLHNLTGILKGSAGIPLQYTMTEDSFEKNNIYFNCLNVNVQKEDKIYYKKNNAQKAFVQMDKAGDKKLYTITPADTDKKNWGMTYITPTVIDKKTLTAKNTIFDTMAENPSHFVAMQIEKVKKEGSSTAVNAFASVEAQTPQFRCYALANNIEPGLLSTGRQGFIDFGFIGASE